MKRVLSGTGGNGHRHRKDGKGAILTFTERLTNFSMAAKLPKGKEADALARTAIKLLTPYIESVRTITTDNGTEFACHRLIAKKLHITVLFRPFVFRLGERGYRELQ